MTESCELAEAETTCTTITTACTAVDQTACVGIMDAFQPAAHADILTCITAGMTAGTETCDVVTQYCIWDPWFYIN
jgi:hypothetical protein